MGEEHKVCVTTFNQLVRTGELKTPEIMRKVFTEPFSARSEMMQISAAQLRGCDVLSITGPGDEPRRVGSEGQRRCSGGLQMVLFMKLRSDRVLRRSGYCPGSGCSRNFEIARVLS